MARGTFKNLRFCPSCGAESLERDDYRFEQQGREIHRDHNEWVCRVCNLGMQITPSFRQQLASKIIKTHRAKNFVDDVKSSRPGKR